MGWFGDYRQNIRELPFVVSVNLDLNFNLNRSALKVLNSVR